MWKRRESPVSEQRRNMPRTDEDIAAFSDGTRDGSSPSISMAELADLREPLLRLAYRFVWNSADAEDVVHDAIVQAYRKQGQLADRSKLGAWVRSIVVRRCRWVSRRARHRLAVRQQMAVRGRIESYEDGAVERADAHARLRRAIASLPNRQKAALILRDLEQMAYREVAQVMGVTESTVRVLVRSARERLRDRLVDDDANT